MCRGNALHGLVDFGEKGHAAVGEERPEIFGGVGRQSLAAQNFGEESVQELLFGYAGNASGGFLRFGFGKQAAGRGSGESGEHAETKEPERFFLEHTTKFGDGIGQTSVSQPEVPHGQPRSER